MCSTPGTPQRIRSIGATMRLSTSAGSAPGQATITSTIGARICGSSSRGVARRARAPRPRDPATTSGVSVLPRKERATVPANPRRMTLLPLLDDGRPVDEPGRVDDDPLARLHAGPDLDGVAVARADGRPAQAGVARVHDEDAREAAPLEERRRGDAEAGRSGDSRDEQAREEPRAQAGGIRQLG